MTCAEADAPITQFYLGVATGQLEGEAAAWSAARAARGTRSAAAGRGRRPGPAAAADATAAARPSSPSTALSSAAGGGRARGSDFYERALKQLPLLHNARNNLIRGLMRRGSPQDLKQAIEHANLSAGLQVGLQPTFT